MTSAPHPSDAQLAGYGLGTLDDGRAATVHDHLVSCAACRRRVAATPADNFVGRLRAAASPDGTPEPSKALSGFEPTSTPPAVDVPPELASLTQYTGLRELGRGGMGVVYLAWNALMEREEVLKVVHRPTGEHSRAADRFLQEIRAAAKLRHPHVVAAYDAKRIGDLLVLSMEYVPGEDLAKLCRRTGPVPTPLAAWYAYQAALGLQHAHECGMVHRDVKPGNLILGGEAGRPAVKVLDFGLAKATAGGPPDRDLTGTGQVLGTPGFIAPEQILDAAGADTRADVYSLGCTLYYLLSGGPPFRGGSQYEVLRHHLETDATPVNLVRPGVPAGLAAVVARMMAKDPADRYHDPAGVARALAPFLASPPLRLESPPDPALLRPTAGRWSRRRLAAASLLLAAGVAGVAAAGVFETRPRDATPVAAVAGPADDVVPTPARVELGDALVVGSVWVGTRTYTKGMYSPITVAFEMHVVTRTGAAFAGHVFDNGSGRNEHKVEGEITPAGIAWVERSTRIKEMTYRTQGTFDGVTIRATQRGENAGRWTSDTRVVLALRADETGPPVGDPVTPPKR